MPTSPIYADQPPAGEVPLQGSKDTVTAGTAVPLSSTSVPTKEILIQAKRTNTGRIYFGGSGVKNDDTAGCYLIAGASVTLSYRNLNLVYINSTVDAEGVTFNYP